MHTGKIERKESSLLSFQRQKAIDLRLIQVITPGSGNVAGGTGCGCALTAINGSVCDIIKNHLSS
jgi:hypothetical protein